MGLFNFIRRLFDKPSDGTIPFSIVQLKAKARIADENADVIFGESQYYYMMQEIQKIHNKRRHDGIVDECVQCKPMIDIIANVRNMTAAEFIQYVIDGI